MSKISKKAFAKINLTLDVLEKRADGYHELSSVMQTLELHDTITITTTQNPKIAIKTNNLQLHTDERNLVYKAADYILKEYKLPYGVDIELTKEIPLAAGLAGGSSDCAATLLGLNTLFGLNITKDKLYKIGQTFGADVPFCLMGGTALAEGIGEKLTPLTPHPNVWVGLARPKIHVPTKDIFAAWSKLGKSNRQTPGMLTAIKSGNLKDIISNFGNDLAPATTSLHPAIKDVITTFNKLDAIGVNMTGSGPTVFAYFTDKDTATNALNEIKKLYDCDIFLTKITK